MSTSGLRDDLRLQEEEILARRVDAQGDAFDRITDELMEVRRQLNATEPEIGPQLVASDIYRVIASGVVGSSSGPGRSFSG